MSKKLFDLQRLEKEKKVFSFPAPDGAPDVTITCHYPSEYEIAAATASAKSDIQRAITLSKNDAQGVEAMEELARMGAALQNLACYCIDSCSALPIKKIKCDLGLRRIDEETEEALGEILMKIGKSLTEGSKVSEEEKEV
jgi:hypothetical protein